ncbi:NUDIX domain-containing protein [Streptomyces sp. RB6PN25]|uniref:NUDIX domain-containing protein n=1 Tax=Streptomyces humicola TaxID=2953240 RepID=A0ABT1PRU0_9ACTN|nr:NUDIX domain-containing protein [Streptomyces humicola]MCQ4080386.1 NUDIX domain-containing protein [Streptomyces humicola]
MAIPQFLAELRSVVGTRPLWLSGVTAVVLDDEGRVLLGKRADTGEWALISGIIDPGEQPADAAARECWEETGVLVVPERISSVGVSPEIEYANGDRAQYLDITFRCRAVGGEARVNDDESLDVGWFALDALPELSGSARRRLALALDETQAAAFDFSGVPAAAE